MLDPPKGRPDVFELLFLTTFHFAGQMLHLHCVSTSAYASIDGCGGDFNDGLFNVGLKLQLQRQ